ncbi:hypothetical protein [Anaerotalea alkaliphila]|uniref:hypothetical protein n=1 Tax=Anaerotalea alkaliphila TaxID=2662126 RepID=UPI0013912667|nr:hypothetical protein [Anaerotalea alkaliphila]
MKMNLTKEKAVGKGRISLSYYHSRKFGSEYDRMMDEAKLLNPQPERPPEKRGRMKRGKVLALIQRLVAHKGEVCLFAKNFSVPFTNNTA